MNRFGLFFGKLYPLLLFLLLEALAINYYSRHSSLYNNARLRLISYAVVGGVYNRAADVRSYFSLGSDNRAMMSELARLRDELAACKENTAVPPFSHYTARVVNNSINRTENFFTIDRGTAAGIERRSAVLAPNGAALGYVLASSERFSVCISMLNTRFRTSGNIKGSSYFGSIFWDGCDSRYVTMSDVSRYARVEAGDTVVTTGYSSIFPPDAPIGTVERCDPSDNGAYFNLRVRLWADFSALRDVLVVRIESAAERTSLEESAGAGSPENEPTTAGR